MSLNETKWKWAIRTYSIRSQWAYHATLFSMPAYISIDAAHIWPWPWWCLSCQTKSAKWQARDINWECMCMCVCLRLKRNASVVSVWNRRESILNWFPLTTRKLIMCTNILFSFFLFLIVNASDSLFHSSVVIRYYYMEYVFFNNSVLYFHVKCIECNKLCEMQKHDLHLCIS